MTTLAFWKRTAERAVKTFCQTLAATLVADQVGVLGMDWKLGLSLSAGAALTSVLTSVASLESGPEDSPSLVD